MHGNAVKNHYESITDCRRTAWLGGAQRVARAGGITGGSVIPLKFFGPADTGSALLPSPRVRACAAPPRRRRSMRLPASANVSLHFIQGFLRLRVHPIGLRHGGPRLPSAALRNMHATKASRKANANSGNTRYKCQVNCLQHLNMKYRLYAISPATASQTVEIKHYTLFNEWKQAIQGGCWEIPFVPKAPNSFRGSTGASCEFPPFSDPLTTGIVTYRLRTEPRMATHGNDWLEIIFNPNNGNYNPLLTDVIPLIINTFSPSYLELGDESFSLPKIQSDGSILPGGPRACGGVVFPVFFMSEKYLQIHFGLTIELLLSKLDDVVEGIQVKSGGVYVIGSSKVLTFEEAITLTQNMEKKMRNVSFFSRMLSRFVSFPRSEPPS